MFGKSMKSLMQSATRKGRQSSVCYRLILALKDFRCVLLTHSAVVLPIFNENLLGTSGCRFELFFVQQKGLVSYIKRYEYKNAKTEDLWSVLSEVSGEPVKELMDSWTKQQGYPVVSVKLRSEALVIEQVIFDKAILYAASELGESLYTLQHIIYRLPSHPCSDLNVHFKH